jgi:hypothetical protein
VNSRVEPAAVIEVSEVADSVNALGFVPESAILNAPVGTVPLFVIVTLRAVGTVV